jgi:adenine phosphoribosyltransferase
MEDAMLQQLKTLIRDVPNFPSEDIIFRDITPLMADPAGLALAVELMANPFRKAHIDVVLGAESRGFIFGTAIARAMNVGFIPVRKPGKLPFDTISQDYELEYGTDTLQIHADAIAPGQRVLIVDDLVATGGTLVACRDLVKRLGGEVIGISVLVELESLGGRDRLIPDTIHSVLTY